MGTGSSDAPPPIGHNAAPLADVLFDETVDLRASIDALADMANDGPRTIKTDGDLDAVGKIVVKAREVLRNAEAMRVIAKEPHLTAERTVDKFFGDLKKRVERIALTYGAMADNYARAMREEAKRVADEAARRARIEEEKRLALQRKAEEDGRHKMAAQHADKAAAAADNAARAEQAAAAKPADMIRTRTESGILSTATAKWTFEIINAADIPLDLLRPYFTPDAIEAALRKAVNANMRELPGVRIYEDVKATFRG